MLYNNKSLTRKLPEKKNEVEGSEERNHSIITLHPQVLSRIFWDGNVVACHQVIDGNFRNAGIG